jgi:hypothetical protein
MKSTGKIAVILAATAAVGMLVTTSASAEERHRDGTWRDNGGYSRRDDGNRNNNNYRNESRNNTYRNESRDNHISEHGRISRFTHERDGYRVWLDRGTRSYWIPESRLGRRRLSIGLDIRLGGIFNGTYVDVDALGWPGDPYYNDPYYAPAPYYADGGYLSGRVERVDYRYGTLLLRDARSGRVVEVDMRAADRRGGLDLGDVRPGDRITLDGTWDRGYFHAFRIDRLRPY